MAHASSNGAVTSGWRGSGVDAARAWPAKSGFSAQPQKTERTRVPPPFAVDRPGSSRRAAPRLSLEDIATFGGFRLGVGVTTKTSSKRFARLGATISAPESTPSAPRD